MKPTHRSAAAVFAVGLAALFVAMLMPGPLLLLTTPSSFLFYAALLLLGLSGPYLTVALLLWLRRQYASAQDREVR